jgi:hypothetical protein
VGRVGEGGGARNPACSGGLDHEQNGLPANPRPWWRHDRGYSHDRSSRAPQTLRHKREDTRPRAFAVAESGENRRSLRKDAVFMNAGAPPAGPKTNPPGGFRHPGEREFIHLPDGRWPAPDGGSITSGPRPLSATWRFAWCRIGSEECAGWIPGRGRTSCPCRQQPRADCVLKILNPDKKSPRRRANTAHLTAPTAADRGWRMPLCPGSGGFSLPKTSCLRKLARLRGSCKHNPSEIPRPPTIPEIV